MANKMTARGDAEEEERMLLEEGNQNDAREEERDTLMALLSTLNSNIIHMGKSLKRNHSSSDQLRPAEPAKRPRLSNGTETTPEAGEGSDSDSEALLTQNREESSLTQEDDSLLDALSKSLEGEEETSPPIPEKLAAIVEKRWNCKLATNKMKEKQKKILRPENCKTLVAPRVNKAIWTTLNRDVKSKDIRLTQPQQILATAGRAILQSTVSLLEARNNKTKVNIDEIIAINTDVLALLGHSSADIAQLRRDNIPQSLSEHYKVLCSTEIPVTDHLFGDEGDFQTRVKAITDSNKISKSATRNDGVGFNKLPQSLKDSRQIGNKYFLGQGYSNKNHPRQFPGRRQFQRESWRAWSKTRSTPRNQNQTY
eukprot:gene10314-11383_t